MPDTTPSEHDQLEQAITQWRETLKGIAIQSQDELEDHLRNELQQLSPLPLAPRERVVLAADRLGGLAVIRELATSETGSDFKMRRWTHLALIIGLIQLGVWATSNIIREGFNEIDDSLMAYVGSDAVKIAVVSAQSLAGALVIGAGVWLLRADRHRRTLKRRMT